MMNVQYTTPEAFKDIAPIDDCDFNEKMSQLVKEPGFEHAIRYAMPDVDYQAFVEGLLKINNKKDFQHMIIAPFLEMLAKKTTSGLSISGVENIDKNKCYTFITNHRDIVLDASFLNVLLWRNGLPTTEIAIGSNLLVYEWISDLVRLNKSFIVKRNLKMLQALAAAKQLSAYIHHAINEKHESVWIAQREGRSKDSNDFTQESLIKMIGLAGGDTMLENLKQINLLPVAISYEYDANDYLKAREFLLKHKDPEFKKSQRDDLLSMETGLMQYKGHVHFTVGKCITPSLESLDKETDRSEVLKVACKSIDNLIHAGYYIYPINYIAHDKLESSTRFAEFYTAEQVAAFDKYIESQLAKVDDVPNLEEDDYAFMRQRMLEMYANPLKNQLALEQ